LVELFNSVNKIVLAVEYDGRNYCGFQLQANLPTIQAELENAIRKVTGQSSRVMAASRTDTGVHAKGQMVSFRTKSSLNTQVFIRALNYYLPQDIAVKGAYKIGMDFNVRRDAISREYEYIILNSSTRSPLLDGFAYFMPKKLNTRIMNKACKFLEGEHDFASFAAALGKLGSTVRTVHRANVVKKGDVVTYTIIANSFLPHQVRNTIGLLIRVGLGKVGLDEFRQIMDAREVGRAGPAAPPCGLCLTKVNYPSNLELAI
jgi:tRNA pseudouridine38-40 synthase